MATAHVGAAARNLERPGGGGRLEASISAAAAALIDQQRADGHFVFELEADATIPAEYVLLRHYLAEPVDAGLEHKIAVYLRRIQSADGGWPLFHEGASNISASVKGYFALKMIGEPVDAAHMLRARQWILAQGGAASSNVFTRNLLALYGALPWRGVPVVPVEIVLLPRWFPFHIDKISYWARTVLVPLTVLNALKPKARNPKAVRIDELFVTPPEQVRVWPRGPHQKWPWAQLFGGIDRLLRTVEPFFPAATRERALNKAVQFVRERLNGEDGLGAIFPAMANAVLMFDALGYPPDHPSAVPREPRSTSCWWLRRTRLIANRAYRRCGIRRSSPTRYSKWAHRPPRKGRGSDLSGCCLGRSWISWGTGQRAGPAFVPGGGPSSMR